MYTIYNIYIHIYNTYIGQRYICTYKDMYIYIFLTKRYSIKGLEHCTIVQLVRLIIPKFSELIQL